MPEDFAGIMVNRRGINDDQVNSSEKKQDEDVAHGEIETAHSGYLGSKNTFYDGNDRGIGRISVNVRIPIPGGAGSATIYNIFISCSAKDEVIANIVDRVRAFSVAGET